MIEHVVNIPAKMIGKEELAEMLGIEVSTLNNRAKNQLPPAVEGYKNRWYYPAVHEWLMQQSQQSYPRTRKKPTGF